MAVQLDRVASALHITPEHAMVQVAALRAAFEINGKALSFDKTARILVTALKQRNLDDPDVHYAADWIADLAKKSTGTSDEPQNASSKGKVT